MLPDRDFTEFSTSVGALIRPQAASDNLVVAVSLARAARNPALEELYFFGPHPGNFSFEIGNPDLRSETALGFDVSVRARAGRVQGEITVFRNDIDDFIFRSPLTDEEFAAREEEFDERFGIEHEDGHHETRVPLHRIQRHRCHDVGCRGPRRRHASPSVLGVEATYDFVRAERKVDGQPMPRIPPQRLMAGLRYTSGPFQAGVNATAVARQDRVYGAETETAAYGLLRFFATYTLQSTRSVQTVTARLDNATDTSYRNHLNYLKDVVHGDGPRLPPGLLRQVLIPSAGATWPASTMSPCPVARCRSCARSSSCRSPSADRRERKPACRRGSRLTPTPAPG